MLLQYWLALLLLTLVQSGPTTDRFSINDSKLPNKLVKLKRTESMDSVLVNRNGLAPIVNKRQPNRVHEHSPQTANSDEGIQNDEASYQRPSTTVDKIKRNHKKLHGIHTRRFTEPDVLSGVPLNTQAIRMLKDLYHERWGTTPPRPPPSESPEPCQRTQGSAGLLLPPPPSSKSSEPCQRTQLSAGDKMPTSQLSSMPPPFQLKGFPRYQSVLNLSLYTPEPTAFFGRTSRWDSKSAGSQTLPAVGEGGAFGDAFTGERSKKKRKFFKFLKRNTSRNSIGTTPSPVETDDSPINTPFSFSKSLTAKFGAKSIKRKPSTASPPYSRMPSST